MGNEVWLAVGCLLIGYGVGLTRAVWHYRGYEKEANMSADRSLAEGLRRWTNLNEKDLLTVRRAADRIEALEATLKNAPVPYFNKQDCHYCGFPLQDGDTHQHYNDCWYLKAQVALASTKEANRSPDE